jgi:glyoxylase-like metal-dependent hydrolase (beta-lactamase superfamily II)
LYEFDCGRLTFETPSSIFGVRSNEIQELLVPCYLVEHPKGRLLWDGGLPSDRGAQPLENQFAALGLSFDSLDYVAFSHMHFDHVGVANELESGVVLIQRTEYEAAFADEIDVPAYEPVLYQGLRGMERQLLDGDHDVFGDGSVVLLSLPGHTPGHQALFVDLAHIGPIVLSGDLYHFRESRSERIVPGFNVDREATLRSMDRLESFLERRGATLWIEHDLERYLAGLPSEGYHR